MASKGHAAEEYLEFQVQSPKGLKFCRHDHKDLVNIPTTRIDELLHGLGGIEEFPSKNGVFSRTQKLLIKGTHDSAGFSTRLDGLESLQKSHVIIKKQPLISCSRIDKRKIEFVTN